MSETLEMIDRCLSSRGWGRCDFEGGGFVKFDSPSVIYQLRLDLLEKGYGIRLNPSLGVRCPTIGDLVSRFIGLPHSGNSYSGLASVGVSLSDLKLTELGLVNFENEWSIFRSDNAQEAVRALSSDILFAEENFFNKFREINDVVEYLERTRYDQFQLRQLAVGQALTGREEAALMTLGEYFKMVKKEPPLVADQARLFITSFSEYFGIEEGGWRTPEPSFPERTPRLPDTCL
ncbi:hypothetical protein ABZ644_15485 [Nocardiopsis alba]|uniref:hypothetical protein n=1 Tax=Nocardiopsis alba TaxID=53437 RepID=UPI00340D59E2